MCHQFSFAFSELCVAKFNTRDLEGIEMKLDRLNIDKAAEITRETCSSPTSLVLALLYLDRLRSTNPKYLNNISPTDLFLVSLMVASKFLHDDGEEDEVFNDEWANSGGMEKKELNNLELDFLTAIDWKIYVSPDEYEETTKKLELAVAVKQVSDHPILSKKIQGFRTNFQLLILQVHDRGGWTTYSDLMVLSRTLELIKVWETLYEYTLKVTAVCAFAYAASLMTMLGTCQLLSNRSTYQGMGKILSILLSQIYYKNVFQAYKWIPVLIQKQIGQEFPPQLTPKKTPIKNYLKPLSMLNLLIWILAEMIPLSS